MKKSELLSKSLSSMAIKFAGMFAGYGFIFIALRISDIQHYGSFSLSLAFINIASILGRLGFDTSIVKNISLAATKNSETGNCREIYFKGLQTIFLSGILLSTLSFILSPMIALYVFGDTSQESSLRISSLAILPHVLLFYNAGALRGLKNVAKYSTLINLNFLVAIAFLLILLLVPVVQGLEISYVLASVTTCILSFVWWFQESGILNERSTNRTSYRELLLISFPMLSASTITILNGWSDTLMLGVLSTNENVGIFQVLLKLSAIISIVLFAVNSISAPQFARLNTKENKLHLQQYLRKSTKLIVVIVTPLSIMLLLGYSLLIKILGADFNSSLFFPAFCFLCFGQVFNAFSGSGGQLLSMTGYHKINRNIIFLSFLVSVLINFLLIPQYGVLGAALANMIGLIVRNLMYIFFIQKKLELNTLYNPIGDMMNRMHKSHLF